MDDPVGFTLVRGSFSLPSWVRRSQAPHGPGPLWPMGPCPPAPQAPCHPLWDSRKERCPGCGALPARPWFLVQTWLLLPVPQDAWARGAPSHVHIHVGSTCVSPSPEGRAHPGLDTRASPQGPLTCLTADQQSSHIVSGCWAS